MEGGAARNPDATMAGIRRYCGCVVGNFFLNPSSVFLGISYNRFRELTMSGYLRLRTNKVYGLES